MGTARLKTSRCRSDAIRSHVKPKRDRPGSRLRCFPDTFRSIPHSGQRRTIPATFWKGSHLFDLPLRTMLSLVGVPRTKQNLSENPKATRNHSIAHNPKNHVQLDVKFYNCRIREEGLKVISYTIHWLWDDKTIPLKKDKSMAG